jgi:hypothetical protein
MGAVTDDETRSYVPQPIAPQASETRPPDLRGVGDGLRRLSRGLIAYGIIGVIVAAIGFGALVWVNGRIGAVADRVDVTVGELATTMEHTATVLHDASATATSFTTTLDHTTEALNSAADSIAGVRSNLESLASLFRAVNILGATPLGAAADAVSGIAKAIEGLDTRMSAIADSLQGNRDALAQNAASLGQLGDSTAALAARLRSGVIETSVGDIQLVIAVTLLVFSAWAVVPAVGALVLGIWLRRQLGVTQRSA